MDAAGFFGLLILLAVLSATLRVIYSATRDALTKSARRWATLFTALKLCGMFSLLGLFPQWCFDEDAQPWDFGSYSFGGALWSATFFFVFTAAPVLFAAWKARSTFPDPDGPFLQSPSDSTVGELADGSDRARDERPERTPAQRFEWDDEDDEDEDDDDDEWEDEEWEDDEDGEADDSTGDRRTT